MKIAESVLREKIGKILLENFSIDAPLGREYSMKDDGPSTFEIEQSTQPKTFKINNLFISNLIDSLTTLRDGTNLAWRYIAEGMLVRNLSFVDLNAGRPGYVFADVEGPGGVKYSVKSSFQKRSTTPLTPLHNHPIRVYQIEKHSDLEKLGIITCHRRASKESNYSEIVWTQIGNIVEAKNLKNIARENPNIKEIRRIWELNTFFNAADPGNTKDVPRQELLVIKFRNDTESEESIESKNKRMQKINFVVTNLDLLPPDELDSLVDKITNKLGLSDS